MKSPVKIRDVQSLTGWIVALNRFIARATDRSLPFFKALKRGVDFVWTDKCERSFQELKEYLGKAPVLSKPMQGETLILYLAVSEAAVSSVLIRLENNVQLPVFYVSRALLDPETRYPEAPLRQILQNPECSGRLAKWAIELSKFDIEYKPRTSIKGQAMADFISEFTRLDLVLTRENSGEDSWTNPVWKLFVDESTNQEGSGIGIVLESPKQEKVLKALRLEFLVSNNEAEYEALLTGLKMARELDVKAIHVFCDSKLVSAQVNTEFQAREPRMAAYLQLAQSVISCFDSFEITHIPQGYYWLSMAKDTEQYVRRCDTCQRFSPLIHQPAEELNSVLSPWPFAKWGIDLIGPLPLGKYRMKFAVVAIDYYTKWVEAEPLSEITEARTTSFVWKNIVYRFGIPHSLVLDNGTQFNSAGLKKLCSELGIKKHFASVAHP
ncbi:hypothetical protein UlMin_001221 [Ulmus minor]